MKDKKTITPDNHPSGSATKNDDLPTIILKDSPEQERYELLKEKLRYKQAKRENERKIDHKEVRLSIQAAALPTKTFYIMNALAAVIAGYGLLANSPAVVIGAMLVAMMMGPISGIALALIDSRLILLRTSAVTLFSGVLVVLTVGVSLGLLHHGIAPTDEIMARTRPNVMDLMIALAGGGAGAFAAISPRLSTAVVGVAVATALVPPLVVSGILIAHAEWYLAGGALLLAFTNMVAIQFSSSLVLWVAGFRRIRDKELESSTLSFIKRNVISLILLIMLGIYLSLNLMNTIAQQRYSNNVESLVHQLFDHTDNLVDTVNIAQQKEYTLVRVVIRGNTPPSRQDVKLAQQQLNQLTNNKPTRLQVHFVKVMLIE